jgi:predicted dinucleotide-binding enzyme
MIMTTAILGLGNMGAGLARRLGGRIDLILGSRDPNAAAALAAEIGAPVASYADAVAKADIVVLAMPLASALEVAGGLDLKGKIVVDMSNPMTPDFANLTMGYTTSAGEEVQKALPASHVVKAFNTIFASVLASPRASTAAVPVFIAGNDTAALDAVAALVTAVGFAPERSGTLDSARLLEPLGLLNVKFAYFLGQGTGIAPAWVKIAA